MRPYKHVLVTGGAGFVGSHVILRLRETLPEARITALDNLRRRGSEFNIPRLAEAGVHFRHGDVRNPVDLEAVGAPDLILECSAEPSATAGYGASPDYVISSNLTGCYHCLELARRHEADFLFISTSRVYPYRKLNELAFRETATRFELTEQTVDGASESGVSESFSLEGPRSLYGMTKRAAELMVEEYGDAYGIRFIINRCGLLTGPWQMARSDQGVVALWLAAHRFNKPLKYVGFNAEGKQVRDFLHVQDFCDLLVEQLTHFERYEGSAFNVGGGAEFSFSLKELTEVCRSVTGQDVTIGTEHGNRPADVRIYISDSRRVSAISGWAPKRNLQTTVAHMDEWMTAHRNTLRPVLLGGTD